MKLKIKKSTKIYVTTIVVGFLFGALGTLVMTAIFFLTKMNKTYAFKKGDYMAAGVGSLIGIACAFACGYMLG